MRLQYLKALFVLCGASGALGLAISDLQKRQDTSPASGTITSGATQPIPTVSSTTTSETFPTGPPTSVPPTQVAPTQVSYSSATAPPPTQVAPTEVQGQDTQQGSSATYQAPTVAQGGNPTAYSYSSAYQAGTTSTPGPNVTGPAGTVPLLSTTPSANTLGSATGVNPTQSGKSQSQGATLNVAHASIGTTSIVGLPSAGNKDIRNPGIVSLLAGVVMLGTWYIL